MTEAGGDQDRFLALPTPRGLGWSVASCVDQEDGIFEGVVWLGVLLGVGLQRLAMKSSDASLGIWKFAMESRQSVVVVVADPCAGFSFVSPPLMSQKWWEGGKAADWKPSPVRLDPPRQTSL